MSKFLEGVVPEVSVSSVGEGSDDLSPARCNGKAPDASHPLLEDAHRSSESKTFFQAPILESIPEQAP